MIISDDIDIYGESIPTSIIAGSAGISIGVISYITVGKLVDGSITASLTSADMYGAIASVVIGSAGVITAIIM